MQANTMRAVEITSYGAPDVLRMGVRPMPVAAEYFVGFVGGEPVCHLAVTPLFTAKAYRSTRLVVLPEWQGIGVGTKFLAAVCEYHRLSL